MKELFSVAGKVALVTGGGCGDFPVLPGQCLGDRATIPVDGGWTASA